MKADGLNNGMWRQIKWRWAILSIVCYYIFFQSFYNLIAYGVVIPKDTFIGTLTSIVENFVPTCLIFFINFFIVFRLFCNLPTSVKIVCDTAASLFALAALNLCYIGIKHLNFSLVNWAGTVFNDVFILLGIEVYHYVIKFGNSMERERQSITLATNYKYEALMSRLNPHFLFNSLSLLYLLIPSDTTKAQEFVLRLSDMYRYVLSKSQQRTVSLAEELSFLDTFEQVMAMGNNNSFSIRYSGRDSHPGKWLIPCTLQLLVENAIRHNVMSRSCPMIVEIAISDSGITVKNALKPKPSVHSSKVGLSYISQMYASYDKEVDISNDGNFFSVTVPFIN